MPLLKCLCSNLHTDQRSKVQPDDCLHSVQGTHLTVNCLFKRIHLLIALAPAVLHSKPAVIVAAEYRVCQPPLQHAGSFAAGEVYFSVQFCFVHG